MRTLTPRSGSAFGLASAYFLRDSILTHPTHPAQSTSCLRQKWRCPLCTRLGPLWAALPVFYFCLFQYSVSSSPRAIKTKTSAYGVALGFSHFLLSGVARSGGRSFFSAPALFFFSLFARRSAEMRFAQSALADSSFRIHFSLPLGTGTEPSHKHFALVQERSKFKIGSALTL
ncbi:MAG: hypothetical protein UT08_C0004G0087 [Candidatus Woesebacteria bacterium GW2011_GWB1_38_8]|uniref:Transmembrane protein n=1 Tax=Candidatus Woesebacteria bacterium GW2011_GWB1_38_8 TaxID=1618570 RepID=A0A0G0LCZ9_9BACT|nr:MAG: hypothetical protein UT08_C0004G0087 [Candidatus Woesebacteria bacterium GW2011_GWB1_38_8]